MGFTPGTPPRPPAPGSSPAPLGSGTAGERGRDGNGAGVPAGDRRGPATRATCPPCRPRARGEPRRPRSRGTPPALSGLPLAVSPPDGCSRRLPQKRTPSCRACPTLRRPRGSCFHWGLRFYSASPPFIFLSRYTPPRRPNRFSPHPAETILARRHGCKMAVRCHAWGKVSDLRAGIGLSSVSTEAVENVAGSVPGSGRDYFNLAGNSGCLGRRGGPLSAAATTATSLSPTEQTTAWRSVSGLCPAPALRIPHPAFQPLESGTPPWGGGCLAPCELRAWVEPQREAQPIAGLQHEMGVPPPHPLFATEQKTITTT